MRARRARPGRASRWSPSPRPSPPTGCAPRWRPGSTLLGENRVQEAAAKAPEVPGARWQLVGPLQSNKARRALEVFEAIQSVDSVELARAPRPARAARSGPGARYPVLVQVNVDDDPAKAGFAPG